MFNLFFSYFRRKQARSILMLYAVIYFALLAEEIAVSRVLLGRIFSVHPIVSTAMIVGVCGLASVYLRYGGQRAVLISDYEQLKVVALFIFVLFFLMFRDASAGDVFGAVNMPESVQWHIVLLLVVFGVAWFGASIDFFSRLNTGTSGAGERLRLQKFVPLALVLLFAFLSIGFVFGMNLSERANLDLGSPSVHAETASRYFLEEGGSFTGAVFFMAIFCMMFTTIDSLGLSLLQLGYYSKIGYLTPRKSLTLFASATVASSLISADAISSVGVFVGSLLVLPLFSILQATFMGSSSFQPRGTLYLWVALIASVTWFAFSYGDMKLDYSSHFLATGFVFVSGLAAYFLASLWRLLHS